MAVDLYVGPLTRYYLGDWENVGQRWAREHGVPYKVVRPSDEEGESEARLLDPNILRGAICDWREVLIEGLGDHLNEPLEWEESPGAPYFTDRPHWDGYAGLLLLAAHEENPEIDPPETVSPAWAEDEALKISKREGYTATEYLHILAPELWLPTAFTFTFRCMDLTGRELTIGSSQRLLEQLRVLNDRTYKGEPEERLEWRKSPPEPGGAFQAAACYGLSVFIDLAEQAIAHRLPIKLDY